MDMITWLSSLDGPDKEKEMGWQELKNRHGVSIVMCGSPDGVICPLCGPMVKEDTYAGESAENPDRVNTITRWHCSHYTIYTEDLE